MTIIGCDFAFPPRPSGQQLASAGMEFAGRYIGPGTADKHLTTGETADLFVNGVDIMLLAEGAPGDVFLGRSKGRTHALQALSHAAALGAPTNCVIYFAADKDVTVTNIDMALLYFAGVGDVMPPSRIGVYGDADIIMALRNRGMADWFFYAAASSWSHGLVPPYIHVRQYPGVQYVAGMAVDPCAAFFDDYGQWKVDDVSAEEIWNYPIYAEANQFYGTGVADKVTDTAGNMLKYLYTTVNGLVEVVSQLQTIIDRLDQMSTGGEHTHPVGPSVPIDG